MTKPKACDNCSCGRAELEAGTITKEQLEKGNVSSSCGKCYLGDAFRCASCPFYGKPAFQPGDKVKLTNVDQTVASGGDREEIKVKNGNKVMLDI
jgi:hypothetical protein